MLNLSQFTANEAIILQWLYWLTVIRSRLLTMGNQPLLFIGNYSAALNQELVACGFVGSWTLASSVWGSFIMKLLYHMDFSFIDLLFELKSWLCLRLKRGKWEIFRAELQEAAGTWGENRVANSEQNPTHSEGCVCWGLTLTYTAIMWIKGESFILVTAATAADNLMINGWPKAEASDSACLIKNIWKPMQLFQIKRFGSFSIVSKKQCSETSNSL